ncbi:MAG: polysaccharide biosynthesis protein [Clostridia bacterium]|nr:polysaccharide biosynthesis protein [Clostridia bacterium]
MKKTKKESFIQGVLALMFSQIIIKILGLVYSMYLTNRNGFGDSGNAIYMGGYQIYALLLTLSSIGVPNAISKLIAERLAKGDKKGADRVFKIAFATFAVIGFTGTLILFLGARVIATYWLAIPECEYTLIALSPAIFFVSISSVIRGYFNGIQKISNTARSQTFEQIFKTTLTIIFVEIVAMITTTNTTLMAAGANLATTCATFLSFTYIFALCQKNRKLDRVEIANATYVGEKESVKSIVKKILAVSIPMSISSLLSSINKNIDSATVVRILKPLLGEKVAKARYGILSSKIDILTSMPLAFNIAFATALVPAISAARVKGDIKTINKRLSFSMLVTILIGLPCTVGMFMYANQILELLFPNASSGGTLLAISAFTIIFTVLAQTINGALQGLGKVRVPAIALGCGVIVKLFTNILLIPIEGIYENGAAIGSVLCHIVSFTIVYNVLKNTVKLDFSLFKMMLKPIFATLIMAVVSYAFYILCIKVGMYGSLATIIGIVVAVVVYGFMIIILKILSKDDILALPKGEKIYYILNKLKIYA